MLYQSILLIDDDKDDRNIFLAALGSLTQVIECTVRDNAEEALAQLETGAVLPELIFLDLVAHAEEDLMVERKRPVSS
jgi:CheY-like chemotaxis protein